MRKIALALALAASLCFGVTGAAIAQHEEHDTAVEGEGEGHHTPEINWFGTGRDEAGNPLPPPLAGMFLAFSIWAAIIYFGARGPLSAFLTARRNAIVDGLEEAKRVEAAAKAKHDEYQTRIDNLDAEIAKLRGDFQRAGMEERDRMVAEASRRAERMHAEAKFLVEQQLKTLREELTREAIEAAVAAAEKILRERSTGADQQRLADEYLARLRQSVDNGTKGAAS